MAHVISSGPIKSKELRDKAFCSTSFLIGMLKQLAYKYWDVLFYGNMESFLYFIHGA